MSVPSLLLATRYGRLGASSRQRLLLYRGALEAAGLRGDVISCLDDAYLRALYEGRPHRAAAVAAYARYLPRLAAPRRHDLVWIEKELLPYLPAALERLVLGRTPYVLDFDDAWFLRYAQHRSRLVRWLLGGKFPALLRGAALVVVANATLRAWAEANGARRVLELPTVVDLDLYPPTPEPAGPFTVAWIGTPMTMAYLAAIVPALQALARTGPLRLLVIGAPGFAIAGVECVHAPWSEAEEAALIARAHVGVMPLPDEAWARGKSAYKLIQYMAAGRAVVASPVGANRSVVRDGETGFLAADEAGWIDALARLRAEPALRARFGAAGRARVAAEYARQATAPRLIAALAEAGGFDRAPGGR